MKLIDKVLNLYENKREFTILQGAYLTIAILSLVFAGLVALINQSYGVSLLVVSLVAIIPFCTNVIAWALISLALGAMSEKRANRSKEKINSKK